MSQFADFVAGAVAVAMQPQQHRYLLVDMSATRGVNVARELALDGHCIDVLSGMPCDWNESASPVLLELPRAQATAFQVQRMAAWLTRWQYGNCVSFIESQLQMDILATELKARSDALLPDDMPVVLRFFDGRVLLTLLTVLHPEQRTIFLAFALRWAAADRRGKLVLLEPQQRATSTRFAGPIEFDVAQQSAMIDAGEADAIIDVLLNQNDDRLMSMLPPQQHECISNALAHAREFGITLLNEQVSFCSLSLELGERFYEERPWAETMPQVAAGSRRFADVVAEMAEMEAK